MPLLITDVRSYYTMNRSMRLENLLSTFSAPNEATQMDIATSSGPKLTKTSFKIRDHPWTVYDRAFANAWGTKKCDWPMTTCILFRNY